jgi:hypothetical protein
MRYHPLKNSLVKRGIIILILWTVISLLMAFAGHSQAVERYYADGIYPVICRILHPLLNLFPFSVGDVVYAVVIIYLIYALLRLVRLAIKKRFKDAGASLLGIVIGVQVGLLIFYLFWGMNYFRPSAAERLNLKDSAFTTAELQVVTTMLIDSANKSRAQLIPADLKQPNDSIYQTAKAAILALSNSSADFKTYSPEIKPSLLTPFMNYLGTSGYYNPFTSEAQMNYQLPIFTRPFVACHEMSHQMGYGAEDEANFAGYIAGIKSKDRLLQYSAYYLAMQEFMHSMRYKDSLVFKQLKLKISPNVRADVKTERDYWLSYQNKINTISSVFYDNFLKANNQPEGLNTYNRMVTLVMAYYRKRQ